MEQIRVLRGARVAGKITGSLPHVEEPRPPLAPAGLESAVLTDL